MKHFRSGLVAGALALGTAFATLTPAWAQELPRGDATALGFDPDRLARMDATFCALVDKGMTPGAVLMLIREPKHGFSDGPVHLNRVLHGRCGPEIPALVFAIQHLQRYRWRPKSARSRQAWSLLPGREPCGVS